MEAAPLISPTSDERIWSKLRNRVESILEDRKLNQPVDMSSSECGKESERSKRLREDSLLLMRGLDSVASSLSQLSDTLSSAQQGVNALSKSTQVIETERDNSEEEPKAKRICSSTGTVQKLEDEETNKIENNNLKNSENGEKGKKEEIKAIDNESQDKGDKSNGREIIKSTNLKKARNLAISMATKATSLAKELKTIKSDLNFMQERCNLLEEENRRLREGFEKGVSTDEDDLLRLQLEALLAEKSRLAQENANLTRENQSLIQLVEYHQLTSQDLTESYEQVIHGICLDFDGELVGNNDNDDNKFGEGEINGEI